MKYCVKLKNNPYLSLELLRKQGFKVSLPIDCDHDWFVVFKEDIENGVVIVCECKMYCEIKAYAIIRVADVVVWGPPVDAAPYIQELMNKNILRSDIMYQREGC